jgi:hypothetical protein
MKFESFVPIEKRIFEYVKANSIETFYFGNLKETICNEFNIPIENEEFVNWIRTNYDEIQQYNKCLEQIRELERNKNEIERKLSNLKNRKKELEDQKQKFEKELKYNIDKEKERLHELQSIPDKMKQIEDKMFKSPLDESIYNTLKSEKRQLELYISDHKKYINENESKIQLLNKEIDKIVIESGETEREIPIIDQKIDELNFNLNAYFEHDIPEINAIIVIIFFITHKIPFLNDYGELALSNLERKKMGQTIIENIRPFKGKLKEIPENLFLKSNNDKYLKKWKSLLFDYFKKMPDFSDIKYIPYSKDFPDWDFQILNRIDSFDMVAAVWFSLRNALKTKPGLTTMDNRIYLWVTNSTFVEIFIRKQNDQKPFIGIYYTKREYHNDPIDEHVSNNIIGGYTNSGFYVPIGIYIVNNDYSAEIYFKQSALLQDSIYPLMNNQSSSAISKNKNIKKQQELMDDLYDDD